VKKGIPEGIQSHRQPKRRRKNPKGSLLFPIDHNAGTVNPITASDVPRPRLRQPFL